MPATAREEEMAGDMIVRFLPARAYARPEIVIFWPGLTVLALTPSVNGALFACAAEAMTAEPPEVAAKDMGAAARAAIAIAPTPASFVMRELIDIGISFWFCASCAGASFGDHQGLSPARL